MNRRHFLRNSVFAATGMAMGASVHPAPPTGSTEKASRLDGLLIIDPHAHPDRDPTVSKDQSASFRFMKDAGMAASCYAVIGDMGERSPPSFGSYFERAVGQLDYVMMNVVQTGFVRPVLAMSDIPAPGTAVPGAILGIEGGDALEGRVERVDEFHKRGVRIITIVRLHNNELGDIQKARGGNPGPVSGGLTAKGRAVLDRMQELGVVVDVAHCSPGTLKDVVAHVRKPVLDSHTLPCSFDDDCGRARSRKEVEWIASTGGVVCFCPGSWNRTAGKTIRDWADELLEMKKLLGSEHIGLGTDGGGGMTLVSGYSDVRDLGKLYECMVGAGFNRQELAAFLGGNVHRVLSRYLA
jgi:microsomal dipeptidase-like Zn-dependent dipeptidase